MIVKAILGAALALVSVPAAAQEAVATVAQPDAARIDAARRFLDRALPPATRDEFFSHSVDVAMKNMIAGIVRGQNLGPLLSSQPGLGRIFSDFTARQRQLTLDDLHAHLPQMIEAQVMGYARLFTAAELDQLGVFFSTPLGRKYMVESSDLSQQPEMAEWQQAVAARAQQRMPAEIQKLIQDIQAELAKEKPSNVS